MSGNRVFAADDFCLWMGWFMIAVSFLFLCVVYCLWRGGFTDETGDEMVAGCFMFLLLALWGVATQLMAFRRSGV